MCVRVCVVVAPGNPKQQSHIVSSARSPPNEIIYAHSKLDKRKPNHTRTRNESSIRIFVVVVVDDSYRNCVRFIYILMSVIPFFFRW